MTNRQVVLSTFDNEAAADLAVQSLKAWDKANRDVKLNSIGVLVLDEKGQVKTHKMGARSTAKGAGIGLVLMLVAPPVGVGAVVAGGLLGHLHHKGLGLKEADRDRIGTELTAGKAAVGVLAPSGEAVAISVKLQELGGHVRAP